MMIDSQFHKMKITFCKKHLFLFVPLLLVLGCKKKNDSTISTVKSEPKSTESQHEQPSETTSQAPARSPVEAKKELSTKTRIAEGKLVITLLENENEKHPGLIRFKLGNGLGQNIESARAWVILLDDQDKIVGQKAFWLSQRENMVLGAQQEREWSTLIDTSGIPKTTKITFSVINCSSGNTIHPESVLISELPK